MFTPIRLGTLGVIHISLFIAYTYMITALTSGKGNIRAIPWKLLTSEQGNKSLENMPTFLVVNYAENG
jgi:hypothetical protein